MYISSGHIFIYLIIECSNVYAPPPPIIFTYMDTSPLLVRDCKCKTRPGTEGLCEWRGLYRVTPALTRSFGFSSLIQRTATFIQSPLTSHRVGGGGGPFLNQKLTGNKSMGIWVRIDPMHPLVCSTL
jgi:hypothetical protein